MEEKDGRSVLGSQPRVERCECDHWNANHRPQPHTSTPQSVISGCSRENWEALPARAVSMALHLEPAPAARIPLPCQPPPPPQSSPAPRYDLSWSLLMCPPQREGNHLEFPRIWGWLSVLKQRQSQDEQRWSCYHRSCHNCHWLVS